MSRHSEFFARLKQIGQLAALLPRGAKVTVDWADAPPDLILALVLRRRGRLRCVPLADGGEIQQAEWQSGAMIARAERVTPTARKGGAKLWLVKP